MCGIAGIIDLKGAPVSPDLLRRMTDSIMHRGPDDEGQWIQDNVGFGHRRLSIIDLSPAGHQPMVSLDARYVLSYNGEVYNFQELRVDLEREGYQFRSKTDSEVVLNALAAWGVSALDRFNGMFALSFFDRKTNKLLLARDRYGIKPLYVCQQGATFSFASEQKAIFANPDFQRRIDKSALLEYFTFQNIFTDRTLLEDIRLLPAGHYGVLDLKDPSPSLILQEYWDYNFSEPTEKASVEEYREELDRLFHQAVTRQLVTDVELGSYLSGGIDSGAITAVAATEFSYLKTFTCGFDLSSASGIEMAFDERVKAEAMSYHFKTEHYEMVLKAGDMERVLPELAWHLEEPRVGQSYPNYYAAQLASKFVKVVLSGVGGDELFGGYPWRYYRGVVNNSFEDYADKYYQFWQRLLPNTELREVFAPIWKDVEGVWTRDIFRDVFKYQQENLDTPEDYINHSLYFEAKTFLHGLLVVEDKLSMAHSLETRVPFLDNDLVDFAMRCPVNLKLNNLAEIVRINENEAGDKQHHYFQKTRDGKQILRDVMKKYIPEEVVKAEKQGFSAPDASWFKGESIEFVKRTLQETNARIYEYLDRDAMLELVQEHLDGTRNRRLLIWSLLNVDKWITHLERKEAPRVVFLGATSFGLKCLSTLNALTNCKVVGAVTVPEMFSISYSPNKVRNVMYANVAEYCDQHEIPCVEMKENMREPGLLESVQAFKPDFFVVAGWYHLVPQSWRKVAPAYGLHASLLPDYSGGAPLVWAIMNGEKRTGITLFQLADGVDNGSIAGQLSTEIYRNDTIKTLYGRIEDLGIQLLRKYVPMIADGTIQLQIQDESSRRVFRQRSPDDGVIDWSASSEQIFNFIRAQTKPYPGAFFMFDEDRITVWHSRVSRESITLLPGELRMINEQLFVGCGDGTILEILEIALNGTDIGIETWWQSELRAKVMHGNS